MVPVPFAAAAFAGPATPRTSPDATRSSGSSRWPSVRSTLGRGLVGSMIGPPVVHDIVDLTISFDYFIRGQSLENQCDRGPFAGPVGRWVERRITLATQLRSKNECFSDCCNLLVSHFWCGTALTRATELLAR